MKRAKVYWRFLGSERLTGKDKRRKAKRDLSRGKEPETRYNTGKMWND